MKHVGSAASPRQVVLVTGFGAFPGTRTNPTAAILGRLERSRLRLSRLGIELHCALIPVVFGEIETALRRSVATCRPNAILHLGLASRRRALCVEMRAINRAGPLHPDAKARLPASQILQRGAAPSLASTYRAAEILAAMRRAGVAAQRSIDAGDYVCNATLYQSLAAAMAPQIGFLHVPRTRRTTQPSARTRTRKPTIDMLAQAALAAILVMGRRRPS